VNLLFRSSAPWRVADVAEEEAIENIDVGGPTMIRRGRRRIIVFVAVVRAARKAYDAVLERVGGDG